MSDTKYKEFRVEYVARIPDRGQSDEEIIAQLQHDVVGSTHHDQYELVIRPRTLEVENVSAPFPSADPVHAELYRRFAGAIADGEFDPEDAVIDDFSAKASNINNEGVEGQFNYLVEAFGPEGLAKFLDEQAGTVFSDG